ncbi:transcription termination/antitermination protein NusA, partial [Candidatus Berkelbacteria bacterium]|nr:transcription termination/antitermination protein NusA [Candidatus Berkelbacteria bacterium]
MTSSPLEQALKQISDEKGLPEEVIRESIDAAIAAAYRRDYGHPDEVLRAKFDPETGKAKVWRVWTVVEPEA